MYEPLLLKGLFKTLTKRQAQVLFWRCQGYELEEIADILGIEFNSVQTQMSYVSAKLGMGHTRKEVRRSLRDSI